MCAMAEEEEDEDEDEDGFTTGTGFSPHRSPPPVGGGPMFSSVKRRLR